MVIYIEEYLRRRHIAHVDLPPSAMTASPESLRGYPMCVGYPQRMTPFVHCSGSAALALSPDAITLPAASDLNQVYDEASLI